MYKIASRNLQRRHRVAAPLPTGGYVGQSQGVDHDFIPSADNMSLDECLAEHRQLIVELTKAQNELIASKAAGDKVAIEGLGHRVQGYCTRLSLIKKRMHRLREGDHTQAFITAAKEIVSQAMLEQIYARQQEILAAVPPTAADAQPIDGQG